MRKTGHFGLWQMAFQALQLVTGFLLASWMSIEAYAQYGLAIGFQNVLSQLTDLGIAGSLVALVGDRIHDKEVIGRHIRATLSFRRLMLLILGPLSAIGFFLLARTHGWSVSEGIILFSSILGFLIFQGRTACYTAPLLMHMQVGPLYRPGVMLNAAKLAGCALLHGFSALSASAVCWLNAIGAMFTGRLYHASARRYVTEPIDDRADAETRRAVLRYIAPLVPVTVFYAFQGQIQVLLITMFGKSQGIAEVTALGRLGQIFLILVTFNSTLLTPFIARVPFSRLAVRYLQAALFMVGVAGAFSTAAYFFPDLFLSLLGQKYMGLHRELGLSVLSSSIGFVSGGVYAMNNTRKWTFRWVSVAAISGVLVIQCILVAVMDLSNTYNVLLCSAIPSGYSLLVLFTAAFIGYRKDKAEYLKGKDTSGEIG